VRIVSPRPFAHEVFDVKINRSDEVRRYFFGVVEAAGADLEIAVAGSPRACASWRCPTAYAWSPW